jgi:flavin reductase (DIM6/NTAB) family NADH-FMN oxidoreductase RutF
MYKQSIKKIEAPIKWTKHLMSTHPIVFITTIGKVENKLICGVAPIATCLDTSYEPPYITFSTAVKQHSLVGGSINRGKTNTYLNIKENGLFIVNIPSKKLLEKLDVLAYPRDRQDYKDKIDEARLTKLEPFKLSSEKIYPPLIEECLVHIECKVVDIHQPQGSDHYNITGKVVGVSYDESLGKELDSIKVNLAKQIFHHFGSSDDQKERYIGFIEISKRKNSLIFQLEKTKE